MIRPKNCRQILASFRGSVNELSYIITLLATVSIDHFTVVCLVTWPLNESEAGVNLALILTSLLFLC